MNADPDDFTELFRSCPPSGEPARAVETACTLRSIRDNKTDSASPVFIWSRDPSRNLPFVGLRYGLMPRTAPQPTSTFIGFYRQRKARTMRTSPPTAPTSNSTSSKNGMAVTARANPSLELTNRGKETATSNAIAHTIEKEIAW